MDTALQSLSNRTGRWPAHWKNPSEQEIREGLQNVTLLIRDVANEGKLFVIDKEPLDIYNTDIVNLAETHQLSEAKGLRVWNVWYGRIPIGNHYAGDVHVTVEDVIANLGKFTPDTFIETWIWGVKIEEDDEYPELGTVWRPTFITYVRET